MTDIKQFKLIGFVLAFLVLAGCTVDNPEIAATVAVVRVTATTTPPAGNPTRITPAPTIPPSPTVTLTPSAPPKETATPAPTTTPLPTATAVDSPTPIPTNTPLPTIPPVSEAATTPLPSIWTAIGTPAPAAQAVLSVANVRQMNQLAVWGKGYVMDAGYSPDGRWLHVRTPTHLYLYDVQTAAEQAAFPLTISFGAVHYAPDGQQIVIATASQVTVYDTNTLTAVATITPEQWIQHITFSADWQQMALYLGGDVPHIAVYNTVDFLNVQMITAESVSSAVTHFSFSADGAHLFVGFAHPYIHVWQVADGTLVEQADFGDKGYAVFFAPDNHTVAVAASDHIQLWQWVEEVFVQQPLLIPYSPNFLEFIQITFSPDMHWLVVGLDGSLLVDVWDLEEERLAYIFDAASGQVITPAAAKSTPRTAAKPPQRSGPGLAYIADLAFTPDSQILAATTGFYDLVLWQVPTGTLLHRKEDIARRVTFSADGALYATWLYTLNQWLTADGSRLNTLRQHAGPINDLAFTPDGTQLAAASSDRLIYVRRVADGALFASFQGHEEAVQAVAVSPLGDKIASGSGDNSTAIWDVASGDVIFTEEPEYRHLYFGVTDVAFSPDGQTVASVADSGAEWGIVRLWHTEDGTLQWETLSSLRSGVAFSPQEPLLAFFSPYEANQIELWRVSESTPVEMTGVQEFSLSLSGYDSWLAFSPDGAFLTASLGDKGIEQWDVQAGTAVFTDDAVADIAQMIAFSPDGQLLAVVFPYRHRVELRRAADGALVHTIRLFHMWRPAAVAFSPDGRLLAVGADDGTVRLWGVASADN